DNAADARTLPHLGALDTMGAFPGLYYETAAGPGFTWLRDDAWTHAQRYSADDSDVLVTDMTNPALGLAVTAWYFVPPHSNALVNPLLQHPPAGRKVLQHAVDRLVAGLDEPGVYLAAGARHRDQGYQCGFDDAAICPHQSAIADRTITAFALPPLFDGIARNAF